MPLDIAHSPQYILLDDGWTLCAEGGGLQRCRTPAPRDARGRIPVDPAKFPRGFRPVRIPCLLQAFACLTAFIMLPHSTPNRTSAQYSRCSYQFCFSSRHV